MFSRTTSRPAWDQPSWLDPNSQPGSYWWEDGQAGFLPARDAENAQKEQGKGHEKVVAEELCEASS